MTVELSFGARRLDPAQVPRATSALSALQRIGGSIGTALLAVILQHEIRVSAAPATAFAHTFDWAVGLVVLALIPAAALAWSERGG